MMVRCVFNLPKSFAVFILGPALFFVVNFRRCVILGRRVVCISDLTFGQWRCLFDRVVDSDKYVTRDVLFLKTSPCVVFFILSVDEKVIISIALQLCALWQIGSKSLKLSGGIGNASLFIPDKSEWISIRHSGVLHFYFPTSCKQTPYDWNMCWLGHRPE